MAKVLVTAHLGRHFRIFGHYDYQVLLDLGHEVHIAANFKAELDHFEDERVIKHQVDFERNPYHLGNFKALKQLKKLFKNNNYNIIHTQSPSGGVVTRLAARKTRKTGTKVIYTAHGYHFFQGAGFKNWLIYFNIEKILGIFSDEIITINTEDYNNTKRLIPKVKAHLINGVGIDLIKFNYKNKINKSELRETFGFYKEDLILIFVGELSKRKNQKVLIESVSKIKKEIPNIRLLLVGTGDKKNEYEKRIKELGLQNEVILMGYRTDVSNLLAISDILVSASKQEGLPLNVMEGMAMGLPLVVSNCRGNRDLVDGNGFIVEVDDSEKFAKRIVEIYKSELKAKMGEKSLENVNLYSRDVVSLQMKKIYRASL